MSWAHLHLALNHVPVIGVVLVFLLLAAGVVRRSGELIRASYWLIMLLAVVAVAVYLTGEPAEELVKKLPGFSEPLVEEHEEVALIATIGMSVLGLAALLGLIRYRAADGARWYSKTVLFLGLAVMGLMAWTANLGGQIRHTEIRAQAGSSATQVNVGPGESEDKD